MIYPFTQNKKCSSRITVWQTYKPSQRTNDYGLKRSPKNTDWSKNHIYDKTNTDFVGHSISCLCNNWGAGYAVLFKYSFCLCVITPVTMLVNANSITKLLNCLHGNNHKFSLCYFISIDKRYYSVKFRKGLFLQRNTFFWFYLTEL